MPREDLTPPVQHEAIQAYERLHGVRPSKIETWDLPRKGNVRIELGPKTRECYLKRIADDTGTVEQFGIDSPQARSLRARREPDGTVTIAPEFCHNYGEQWPADRFEEFADVLTRDEFGNADTLLRGHTVVTDHGIEDKPAMYAHHLSSRRNPDAPPKPASIAKAGSAVKPAAAPAKPSSVTTFTKVVLGGVLSAMAPGAALWYLTRFTRFTPDERAEIIAAVFGTAGVLLMPRMPLLGAGALLGTAGAVTPTALDALDAYRAQRTAAQLQAAQLAALPSTASTPATSTPASR